MAAKKEDFDEVLQRWQEQEKAYHYEGTQGVDNLEKLCKAIGYTRNGAYIGASPIFNFLADNSGAIDAIIEWMGTQNVPEWVAELQNELPELEEDEEEE